MGVFLDPYKLKVKVFLGAVRASKASLLLIAFYMIGTLPGSIGISITIVNAVKQGVNLAAYLDILSAIISALLAMVIVSALRGFVVFEYEQNFIFTSPMTPRVFLVAGLLADATAFSFFFFPLFLFIAVIIVFLQLSLVSAFLMVTSVLLFIFFTFFLKTSLSILESMQSNLSAKLVIVTLAIFLILPVVNFIVPFPLKYSMLPYPSTALAKVILSSLSGELLLSQIAPSLVFICLYFAASVSSFLYYSNENLFQFAKPVPLVSPFDTSMKMQTAKMGKNIQFFSRFGLRLRLGLESKSLLRFLMKKEFIRMVRDGSLFAVFLFYIVMSVISLVSRTEQSPFPVWIFILGIYSLMVPFMLISNWRTGELDTLWIPLTSSMNFNFVAKSLLYDLTLIAFSVPAGAIVILAIINQIDPLIPFILITSISMIGCSSNLYAAMHFLSKQRRATPSLMINYLSMLLSGLLISPTYIYVGLSMYLGLSFEVNLLSAALVLVYSSAIFWFFSREIEKKVLRIEI